MNENEVKEIRYLVGEAWKGAYDASVTYGNANVVQDEIGLSVYRSLKSGNVGHPLSDRSWWFLIIDLSSIKTESDRIQALNNAIAADELARVAAENARTEAETQRQANENGRILAERECRQNEAAREAAERTRKANEGSRESNEIARENAEAQRVEAEGTRTQSEQARQTSETERQVNENNRSGAETSRVTNETERQNNELQRQQGETQRNQAFTEAQAQRDQNFAAQMAAQTEAYTLAEQDRESTFNANETERDAKVDAKVGDITNLQEKVTALEAVVADIETIAEGYVRVAGSSSPALSYKNYKYHEAGGFGRESVFSLFYPCLVGTMLTGAATVGKVLHILQKLDFEHDIYGNPRKIDGSEGDVQVCNIEPYWQITGKHTIEGTEYDVFLVSRSPFTWQGIEAAEVRKYGASPDYAVSHTDSDNVTRMHSVFNPDWNGSYSAPSGVTGKYVQSTDPETGEIVETFDPSATLLGGAGGLHTTNLDLPTGEQSAMNNNADPTKTVPWFNLTAHVCTNLQALLLAEGGSFDAHNANKMGSGFSSNDGATAAADWEQSGSGAKNGFRVLNKNGAWKYYALGGNVRFLFGESSGTRYAGQCINSWRNPWHIMEAHRAVAYAIKNDVHELEWFTFEGNKYKYRSVDGFAGPSHGEMTCVVWKFMATQAGANAVDPNDATTSIAGNRVEILVSTCLFHGITTQVSPTWWTSGLVFTEDENGVYTAYIEHEQASLLITPSGDKDIADSWPFESQYLKIGVFPAVADHAKNYHNDALMMPDSPANSSGGGLHTHVGKYNALNGSSAPAGKKSVRGWRRGYDAAGSNLSPLFVNAYNSPSAALSHIGFGACVEIVSD